MRENSVGLIDDFTDTLLGPVIPSNKTEQQQSKTKNGNPRNKRKRLGEMSR